MTTEIICLQDELPIVLIITLDLETFIKEHHVYKDIWHTSAKVTGKRWRGNASPLQTEIIWTTKIVSLLRKKLMKMKEI